jgi:ubiquitin carboxyl-terminal hydrolase 5/13
VDHVDRYQQRTGNSVFLQLRRIRKRVKRDDQDQDVPKKKITKLAIGVDGGFNPDSPADEFEVQEMNAIVIVPGFVTIQLDDPDLPVIVSESVAGILSASSAARVDELQALSGTWDGEKRIVSKHAHNLLQLPTQKRIPPKGWQCEKCDKRDNLWLNLTDGTILCGRRYADGSGGNNHALEHYDVVRYPLAVKLGTITPDGADVYSYDEDDMVEDPLIQKHLSHFGINIQQMQKTEKSMLELEIDMNQRIGEWNILTESNSVLKPLFGPGYTGIANLGNSCYLNSVIQILFSIPDFQRQFFPDETTFENAPADPSGDFNIQMAKLAHGLLSGKYSKEPAPSEPQEQDGIRPVMFKSLIGKGHPEFSTKKQQDAPEFYLHLMNMIDRNFRIQNTRDNPTKALAFEVEDRIECQGSRKVKYTTKTEYLLPLPVPLDRLINQKEVAEFQKRKEESDRSGRQIDAGDVVRPKIPLESCLESLICPEEISDFYSTAIQGKTTARKTSKLKTFPDFLLMQVKKFAMSDDWQAKKLDVAILVPDVIDLAKLRSTGLQQNEEVLPERSHADEGSSSGSSRSSSIVTFDANSLAKINSLMDMGFGMDACKRAVHSCTGSQLEDALNWLFEHQGDADLNDPFTLDVVPAVDSVTGAEFVPDPTSLEALKSMGLPVASAIRGLKETVSLFASAALTIQFLTQMILFLAEQ